MLVISHIKNTEVKEIGSILNVDKAANLSICMIFI